VIACSYYSVRLLHGEVERRIQLVMKRSESSIEAPAGSMKGRGNEHVAGNRKPAVNLLLTIAEMADVPLEKIGPSTGKLEL